MSGLFLVNNEKMNYQDQLMMLAGFLPHRPLPGHGPAPLNVRSLQSVYLAEHPGYSSITLFSSCGSSFRLYSSRGPNGLFCSSFQSPNHTVLMVPSSRVAFAGCAGRVRP